LTSGHECYTLRRVAKVVPPLLSTVGRVPKALGLGRLKNLQPAEAMCRKQLSRSGDMIHVNIVKLAYFERVAHRISGVGRLGFSRAAGYE
jgi:hypothetical protein